MALEIKRIGSEVWHQPIGLMAKYHIVDREDWNLNPSFQRGAVWTQAQKVAWIESILMGLRS